MRFIIKRNFAFESPFFYSVSDARGAAATAHSVYPIQSDRTYQIFKLFDFKRSAIQSETLYSFKEKFTATFSDKTGNGRNTI